MNLIQKQTHKHKMALQITKMMDFAPKILGEEVNVDTDSQKLKKIKNMISNQKWTPK